MTPPNRRRKRRTHPLPPNPLRDSACYIVGLSGVARMAGVSTSTVCRDVSRGILHSVGSVHGRKQRGGYASVVFVRGEAKEYALFRNSATMRRGPRAVAKVLAKRESELSLARRLDEAYMLGYTNGLAAKRRRGKSSEQLLSTEVESVEGIDTPLRPDETHFAPRWPIQRGT